MRELSPSSHHRNSVVFIHTTGKQWRCRYSLKIFSVQSKHRYIHVHVKYKPHNFEKEYSRLHRYHMYIYKCKYKNININQTLISDNQNLSKITAVVDFFFFFWDIDMGKIPTLFFIIMADWAMLISFLILSFKSYFCIVITQIIMW